MILKNVLILTGSAHKQGTSLLLADKFEKALNESASDLYNAGFKKARNMKKKILEKSGYRNL